MTAKWWLAGCAVVWWLVGLTLDQVIWVQTEWSSFKPWLGLLHWALGQTLYSPSAFRRVGDYCHLWWKATQIYPELIHRQKWKIATMHFTFRHCHLIYMLYMKTFLGTAVNTEAPWRLRVEYMTWNFGIWQESIMQIKSNESSMQLIWNLQELNRKVSCRFEQRELWMQPHTSDFCGLT